MAYYYWPKEMKAVEIPFTPRNAFVTFMLGNFGKPKRNAAVQCDCERGGDASVLQVLSFANHPRVREAQKRISQLLKGVIARAPARAVAAGLPARESNFEFDSGCSIPTRRCGTQRSSGYGCS